GRTVLMTVNRAGERVELAAVLSERPATDQLRRLRDVPFRPTPPPRASKPERDEPPAPTSSGARLGVRARAVDGGLEIVAVESRSLAEELDLRAGDILKR